MNLLMRWVNFLNQNCIIVLHQKVAFALSYWAKAVCYMESISLFCFVFLVYFISSRATGKSIWSERNGQLNMLKDVSYRCSTDSPSVCVRGEGGFFSLKQNASSMCPCQGWEMPSDSGTKDQPFLFSREKRKKVFISLTQD